MVKKRKIKTKKHIKKKFLIFLSLVILIPALSFGGYLLYDNVYLNKISKINLKLNGKDHITLELNEEYKEYGAKAKFRKKDISKKIKIENKLDFTKLGDQYVIYSVTDHNKTSKIKRKVTIVDKTAPEITLTGKKEYKIDLGADYVEPGYKAIDNYDGDITENVDVKNNIDKEKEGTYEVTYSVKDSSGNASQEKRVVKYVNPFKALPSENAKATKIAVLNYHFFYDPAKEKFTDGNFTSTTTFEEQLKYLKDNNYKTLTMEEFRAWMYGEIDLPARSVLITIDDGARGTGRHNGNRLIPLLEKYQAHATLFLISGWWNKSNYTSSYLDIESHSHDMHTSDYCSGVSRGAKMLCLSDEEVLADLKTSIETVGSSKAFCYPFYAYTKHSIELVKEAGFKLGFAGGEAKATRSSNKYAIPRYHMYRNTTLVKFNHMIA